MKHRWVVGIAVLACLVVAGGAAARTQLATSTKATKVTLQLKWVTQAQFAGYYAAKAKGYYSQAGLDVNLKVGGPTITPEQVVLGKQAEFGIDWTPSMLSFRDSGKKIMSIAQVFSRSGMTELTWKDSGITTIGKMRGKKVGVWCCGNEPELYAALTKNGIDPKNKNDVTIINQPFNMDLFLSREVDAAAAMTYNELAQVLETKNPKTGKLYKLSDLNVISMENSAKGAGTSMLEDEIFVRDDWIKDKKNQAIARKFLAASFKGWIYCRDHASDCVKIVLKNGPDTAGGPSEVADERDQRADLAEQARHRGHGSEGVQPDGEDREAVQGDQEGAVRRLSRRPRQGRRRAAEGSGRGRLRQEVEEGEGHAQRGREVEIGPKEEIRRCPY